MEKKIPDHHPILLLEHLVDYGPTPFHLFHSWFEMDGFDVLVRDSWLSSLVGSENNNAWVIFMKKLQFLKSNLRVWNPTSRVKNSSKRKEILDFLEAIDARLMNDEDSTGLTQQMVSFQKELLDVDHISQSEAA